MADTITATGKQVKLTKSYLGLLGASLGGNYGVTVEQTQGGFLDRHREIRWPGRG